METSSFILLHDPVCWTKIFKHVVLTYYSDHPENETALKATSYGNLNC